MTLVAASLAGSVGAVVRYLVSGWAQEKFQREFPVGTFTVNVLGSLALGLVVGAASFESTLVVASIGFLGGFTTFSSWMVETVLLGARSKGALVNLTLSLIGGVAAASLGLFLTT